MRYLQIINIFKEDKLFITNFIDKFKFSEILYSQVKEIISFSPFKKRSLI